MTNKEDRSFVSLVNTFHPEDGETCLSPRVRQEFQHSSPWNAVWAEAASSEYNDDDYKNMNRNESDHIPFATASPIRVPEVLTSISAVVVDEDIAVTDETSNLLPQTLASGQEGGGGLTPQQQQSSCNSSGTSSRPPPCVDEISPVIIFGSAMTVAAVFLTFVMGFTALVVYVLAMFSYHLYDGSYTLGCRLPVFSVIAYLIATALIMVHTVLLVLSIFLSELLAVITLAVVSIFIGFQSAGRWHQFIRKQCHLIRWAIYRGIEGIVPEYCKRKEQTGTSPVS